MAKTANLTGAATSTSDTFRTTGTAIEDLTKNLNFTGSVTFSNSGQDDWSTRAFDPISSDMIRHALGLPTDGCIVCSVETAALICDLCVQGIMRARNELVAGMLRDLQQNGQLQNGEDMGLAIYHWAITSTGSRVHAVEFFGADAYDERTVCGIPYQSTKRKRFGAVTDACRNCVHIVVNEA